MTVDEIRAANERALQKALDIIKTRENNLKLAEQTFPGSAMATFAKEQLEAAHKDYAELQTRVAQVLSLIERTNADGSRRAICQIKFNVKPLNGAN